MPKMFFRRDFGSWKLPALEAGIESDLAVLAVSSSLRQKITRENLIGIWRIDLHSRRESNFWIFSCMLQLFFLAAKQFSPNGQWRFCCSREKMTHRSDSIYTGDTLGRSIWEIRIGVWWFQLVQVWRVSCSQGSIGIMLTGTDWGLWVDE